MKLTMVRLAFALMLSTICALAGAQTNVVGKWTGKIVLNTAAMPKAKTAEEKKQLEAGLKMLQGVSLKLELKKDNTFLASYSPPQGAKQVTTGTWKFSGSTLSTRGTVLDGKPIPAKQVKWRTMTLSKDGKTLTRVEEAKNMVKIVFTRAS